MPSYVVKCAPDRDEYVYWSDIVEAPHCIGTRSEVKQYVSYIGEGGADVEARFERADRNGTSALPGFYDWSDRGFIVEQRGWLPRALLAEFTHKFCANDDSCYDLLEPFEDDDLDEPAKASPTQTPGPSGGDPAPLSRQDGQTGSLPLRGSATGRAAQAEASTTGAGSIERQRLTFHSTARSHSRPSAAGTTPSTRSRLTVLLSPREARSPWSVRRPGASVCLQSTALQDPPTALYAATSDACSGPHLSHIAFDASLHIASDLQV